MEHTDLLIKNVFAYNSYIKKFRKANVAVKEGKIFFVDTKMDTEFEAGEVIDGTGFFMMPGFVDIHMHIESSMMTPQPFGERAAECGVTTIVSEPHEMANVKGIRGILEMIQAAKDAPIDIYYGIPSSVPSTNEALETTGGVIDFGTMKKLLFEEDVICVGEVMNYRQVIKDNDLPITKFIEYLQQERRGYVIEGHCPALTGLDLAKFLYLGIDADHTEHTLEEIAERIENGMFVELQDKMLKPEIIAYINENKLYEHVCFVTDDTMADELQEEGQLNRIVKKAVKMGFPLEEAVYCASYTPSRRMNLRERGSIAPGKLADFILVKEKESFLPQSVYKNGVEIYRKDKKQFSIPHYEFPSDFYESIQLQKVGEEAFQITVPENVDSVRVHVMAVKDGSTQTEWKQVVMPVSNHRLQWENSGCLLAVVMERYGKNRNKGYGFVTGDCIREGAAATTYFHDHHNLFVVGNNTEDMNLAANRIIELQGGILTAKDNKILEELPLPVCGILSEGSSQEIGEQLKLVRRSLVQLGYKHYNPIMSLCTLGLPVSPALKLTDCGLIDVKQGKTVPLYEPVSGN